MSRAGPNYEHGVAGEAISSPGRVFSPGNFRAGVEQNGPQPANDGMVPDQPFAARPLSESAKPTAMTLRGQQ